MIEVTPEAIAWFKKEVIVEHGKGIRFFGKVYGKTQVHEGFSVGMNVEQPEKPSSQTTIDGILFFTEESDEWFFQNYNLTVDYDEELREPKYLFSEA